MIENTVLDHLCTHTDDAKVAVGTGKDDPEVLDSQAVTIHVESRDGSFKSQLDDIAALPADRFKMPAQPAPPSSQDPDTFTQLDDIDVCAVRRDQIEILIGADLKEAFIISEVRQGRKEQPLAFNTVFGWTLFGATRGNVDTRNLSVCLSTMTRVDSQVNKLWIDTGTSKDLSIHTTFVDSQTKPELEQLVEQFWVQEHDGILPSRDIAMSVQDVVALKQLENETHLVEGRYEVPLLWSNPSIKLPNN